MILSILRAPLLLLVVMLGLLAWLRQSDYVPARGAVNAASAMPDFDQFQDVVEKKKAFFAYLRPMVEAENARIMANRKRLKKVLTKQYLSPAEQEWLDNLADSYDVPLPLDDKGKDTLLRRVDKLPVALVLAQAANESAWGTSRFATDGNNFFGQWCYVEGCGLVPQQRIEGASHEVAKFKSPQASVRSYIHNINTNGAYYGLRKIREKARDAGRDPRAENLVRGLLHYSQRGGAYVRELADMISHNRRYMTD
ncbi:glucosaminidase domain-containing protein [Gallaecimonas mangrovi]|uniref:glucosaminidase domain-containing protein n=1 Tax=Gallaecimonas mangrovi TaxID=2291597 RepID=UPI000E200FC5|nr:glucosaminidase domain-containing protein [Gallaecimonas mangrovi]